MSRLTGADALGLYEAYQAVYAPQELTEEQVWEEVETWVNSLIEEGYDLSDYTWEEMYEDYLEEQGGNSQMRQRIQASAAAARATAQRTSLGVEKGADGRYATFGTSDKPIGGTRPQIRTGRGSSDDYQKRDAFDRNKAAREQQAKTLADRLNKEQGLNKPKPTPNPVTPVIDKEKPVITKQKPVTPTATATAAAPKPAAAPAAKPAGSAMDQFAKANPKLAASAAERDRTRGTSATTNPLMKDMKSRLPAPKTPSPTTSSTAFSKSTPSLGSSTPEVKSAGTSSGSAGFGKSAPSIGSSAFKPSPASAAPTPTPTTAAATTPAAKPATPKPSLQDTIKKNRGITSSFDLFDLVKGHLLDEGYADTEEAALAIMINMSEEWRQSIIEERAPGVSEYKPNRLNPLPKEKPLSGKKGDGSGYGADEKFKKPDDKITKPGTEVPAPKKGGYGRIFSNIPYGIGAHANRQRSRNSTIRGMDPGAPRSEKLAPTEKKKPSKEIVRKNKDTNESYDYILSHLIYEGYANTVESAENIISNMSEDWILSIIQ